MTKPRDVNENDQFYTRISLIGKVKDQTDNEAWTEFTAYYRKYLYNIVRRIGLDHYDADEVVQNTMLKLWSALPNFEYIPEKGRFRGWLCRIVGNTAKNFIRSRGSLPISLSSIEWDCEDLKDYSVQPEVDRIAKEEWERYLPELALKNISRKLDKRTIQVFQLFSKGVSAKEIAEKLGLAESSVYVYKQRVLAKLTKEIEHLRESY